MSLNVDGSTAVHFVVGDPIVQVKSPAYLSQEFQSRGFNAVVVPAHVQSRDVPRWFDGLESAKNVAGVIFTVPHKFAGFSVCTSTTPRATLLRAANVARRNGHAGWHGDMLDGTGFLAALRKTGCEPRGMTALLVGAGGAGSAIAEALMKAGLGRLRVHDEDASRIHALIERLSSKAGTIEGCDRPDLAACDIVINATPLGLGTGDRPPVLLDELQPRMWVACVNTVPGCTPLIEEARQRGCATLTGNEMFEAVRDLMVEFFMETRG